MAVVSSRALRGPAGHNIGKAGFSGRETGALFKRGAFQQYVGVVLEDFKRMERERLRLVFSVAFKIGCKIN